MQRLTIFLFATLCMVACNNPEPTEDNTPAVTIEETTPVELEERIAYEGDSTIKVVYQIDKNSDLQHGSYKAYDAATDQLQYERTYAQGKMEGEEKFYYPTGELESTLRYKEGIHHGPFQYFYEDGQLKQEGAYEAGKLIGVLKTYYADGQLKEEITHVDGVTEGPFKEYNPNGTLKAEGAYTSKGEDETLEHGVVLTYDEKGELERRLVCKQGMCCTIWTAKKGDMEPSSDLCKAIIEEYGKQI